MAMTSRSSHGSAGAQSDSDKLCHPSHPNPEQSSQKAEASHNQTERLALLFILILVLILSGGSRFEPFTVYLKHNINQHGSNSIRGTALDTSSSSSAPSKPKVCLDVQINDDIHVRYTPDADMESEQCLVYHEPSPYIDLIMKTVVGFPNHGKCNLIDGCKTALPYTPEERNYGNDWPPYGYTMVGYKRLENFRAAIEEVNRNQIPGAIMELGVWRGGSMIMAAAVSNDAQYPRNLWVVDAFETLPPGTYAGASDYLATTEQMVRDNFDFFHVLSDRVYFVKGMFQNTAPALKFNDDLGSIAVLRVDGNFYDSYQSSMYSLYAKVPVGGIVIFDDVFSHPDVLKFWLHFKQDQGITEKINRIDRHSAWFRKTRDVEIDMTRMRGPENRAS
ncbi:O-methyltransferase [Seminavis robusta]|uniref:O-methyltransferase n=1 Tax=Seminavis robusta TaxID=568900 RepID=A0A9N8HMC4_9STRA|nr:O-methyltransferase [Seminavis robusta]|eukprot:Sro895_g217270.1 O-methyltransferase (390) ;mRNA; r:41018-42187